MFYLQIFGLIVANIVLVFLASWGLDRLNLPPR